MSKKHLKLKKMERFNRLLMVIGIPIFVLFAFFQVNAKADETVELTKASAGNSFIKEKQVVELNKNFKNLIEENQSLSDP